MPKAEAGSTKHLANKMKSKGLQRLRWYCQVCEKQCRDDNGFKCHVNSESHVRNMQTVGADPKKAIREYSNQFKTDFLRLLRTAHGEKPVHINGFYQEYIHDKDHVHMNSTQWSSLTEFAKYLGREGVVRVTETDKGIRVAWIDNSPEALRRQDALRKREAQDRGDEEREMKLIKQQIRKANEEAADKKEADEAAAKAHELEERKDGETISISFGAQPKPAAASDDTNKQADKSTSPENATTDVLSAEPTSSVADATEAPIQLTAQPAPAIKMAFGGASMKAAKPKGIFSAGKKANPLASSKPKVNGPAKPLSNMERIMREEMERKRQRDGGDMESHKRMKVST